MTGGLQNNLTPACVALILTLCPKPGVGSCCTALSAYACVHTQGCPHFYTHCLLLRQLAAPWCPTPCHEGEAGGLWHLKAGKGNKSMAFKPRSNISSWQRRRKHFYLPFHLVLSISGGHPVAQFLPKLQLYRYELAFSIFSRTCGVIHFFFFFHFFFPFTCNNHVGTSQLV